MVNMRKYVCLLCSGMQVGDGKVNRSGHEIGWKQCFNLRHSETSLKRKKKNSQTHTHTEVQYNLKTFYVCCSASRTPKNNAYILRLVLEIQVQRETFVHTRMLDTSLKEHPF